MNNNKNNTQYTQHNQYTQYNQHTQPTDADKLTTILYEVPAEALTYPEWFKMLAAIKNTGLDRDVAEQWCRTDPRYKRADVAARWQGIDSRVGFGTAMFIAKQHGFTAPAEWNCHEFAVAPNPIRGNASDEYVAKIKRWASVLPEVSADVTEPEFNAMLKTDANLREQAESYISAVFDDCDVVGLCRTFEVEDGEHVEQRFVRAGVLKQWIEQGHDDYDVEAFCRTTENEAVRESCKREHSTLPLHTLINPVKPNSDNKYNAKSESIASYRHILVEADGLPVYDQFKVLRALNLPITALVYSGNKSLHALVRVDAKTITEYSESFDFVRDICASYGMQIDEACRNVNRWSRTAGAVRAGNVAQTLVATNLGAKSFAAWKADLEQLAARADYEASLIRFGIQATTLSDLVANPPEVVPQIIQNALKKGREGLLIASSKAGKSWLCLKLAAAVADGGTWLGYRCNPCKVGVVNMELGADDVHERMMLIAPHGISNPQNVHLLNCAGVCSDIKALRDTLAAFCKFNQLELLIIDPIYSLMGELEENSNGEVMQFLEILSSIRKETGVATFMTHHTTKGSQDGKNAIDMGSGAGTWARHPDMVVTMQTATEENLRGVPQDVLRAELDAGINYFVLTETLRSFKSTRKSEVWRADFPNYQRADGMSYDRMGAAHVAKSDAAFDKYRRAAQQCIDSGLELNVKNIAAVAGVKVQGAYKYKSENPDSWAAITTGATL